MSRFLLIPFGSAGDVHPFLGLGRTLLARGHTLRMLASPHFATAAESAGVPWSPLGTEEDYLRVAMDPRLWHPQRAVYLVAEQATRWMPLVYQEIEKEARQGPVVLVAAGLALAARLARETLGLKLATVHLQPICFRSGHRFPLYQPFFARLQGLPGWGKGLLYRVIDANLDPHFEPVNAFHRSQGGPRARSFLGDWWHSPDLVLGLFPDWYGQPPPDWPAQTRLTDFPLYDPPGTSELPAAVQEVLAQRPVLVTPGSANWQARPFLEASVRACSALGLRSLVLTRCLEHLPGPLPKGCHHFPYLPLRQVLPHCSALVHHGGIGTLSQGLAAGTPQMVMPMAHDQPENLAKLKQLGAGDGLPPGRFQAHRVREILESLLSSAAVRESCHWTRQRLHSARGLETAADHLEALAGR